VSDLTKSLYQISSSISVELNALVGAMAAMLLVGRELFTLCELPNPMNRFDLSVLLSRSPYAFLLEKTLRDSPLNEIANTVNALDTHNFRQLISIMKVLAVSKDFRKVFEIVTELERGF